MKTIIILTLVALTFCGCGSEKIERKAPAGNRSGHAFELPPNWQINPGNPNQAGKITAGSTNTVENSGANNQPAFLNFIPQTNSDSEITLRQRAEQRLALAELECSASGCEKHPTLRETVIAGKTVEIVSENSDIENLTNTQHLIFFERKGKIDTIYFDGALENNLDAITMLIETLNWS
jgi:hypothetical protein